MPVQLAGADWLQESHAGAHELTRSAGGAVASGAATPGVGSGLSTEAGGVSGAVGISGGSFSCAPEERPVPLGGVGGGSCGATTGAIGSAGRGSIPTSPSCPPEEEADTTSPVGVPERRTAESIEGPVKLEAIMRD